MKLQEYNGKTSKEQGPYIYSFQTCQTCRLFCSADIFKNLIP